MTRVLIAGAGPTGLVLALNLARRGVDFRIVDSADGPGEHSRAMVVQARTLEFYDQLGFAREVVDAGIAVQQMHLWEGGPSGSHEVLALSLADMGKGISPFPFALSYPQDDHEHFLVHKLHDAGVDVEWKTKLVDFSLHADGVDARINGPGGDAVVPVDYLCGADGAHSVVRQGLGLGFAGKTYEQLFFVCDAEIAGQFDPDLRFNLGANMLIVMLPIRSTGMHRLIGVVPRDAGDSTDITFEDIRGEIEPLLGTQVRRVNWFATYRVHHRVAERFRAGRAFILGDAAHIHSPAGGQGMNTGIGDATNLGWKLAAVLNERARETLLDTFEAERIGFARALVATTDRAFSAATATGLSGSFARRTLMPAVMRLGTRFAAVRRTMFRIISQTQIRYPHSPLSEGKAGKVHGGDRLPWVESLDNFAPLRSLYWQLHAFGTPSTQVTTVCERHGVPVHAFGLNVAAARAGFVRDACYLVRPDGYVAVAIEGAQAAILESYLKQGRGPL